MKKKDCTTISRTIHSLDENGFGKLYLEYYPSMLAYARFFVIPTDAEEVVQDVMVWLWENRKKVNITSSIQGYLLRSVRNSCMTLIVQGKAQQRLRQVISNKTCAFYEDTDQYSIADLTTNVETAIKNLPDTYRTVFEKSRFEDKTYPEIASELGISVKTVEYRMTQSLRSLRKALKDYLPFILFVVLSLCVLAPLREIKSLL